MATILIIAGGTAQLIGFAVTYVGLSRTLRHEFADYRPFRRHLADWISRVTGRGKPVTINRDAGHGIAVGEPTGVESYSRPPATSLTQRVERLEKAVANVEEVQSGHSVATVKRFAEVDRRADADREAAKTNLADAERARKASIRPSIRSQFWGLGLFTAGTIATTVGAVLA